jgi:RNA polymerase sigma-70 factor (ECF subfamily)
MAINSLGNLFRRFRGIEVLRESGDLTDGQLLTRFLGRHDDAAFEALLRRHGPMVLGVCRRVLHHEQDAEDAFQATFLVLARKAVSVVPRERVGNWLYGVAYKTALKARSLCDKRRGREFQVMAMPEPTGVRRGQDLWADVQPVLDRELSRLPDKYRFPVVLCDLEGKTHKEAARQLGCPEGTVSVRLVRARALLARRLAQHGLVCSGAVLATVLSQNAAWASVPAELVGPTVEAANLYASGQSSAAGLVSNEVATLTEGVVKTMGMTNLKTLALVLLFAGAGFLACGKLIPGSEQAGRAPESANRTTQTAGKQKEKDDLKSLEGVWRVVALADGSKKAKEEELVGMRWTFQGAKLYISDDSNQKIQCSVKLTQGENPKHLDLSPDEGPAQGITVQGIYKLEKGRLFLCMRDGHKADLGRPKEFVADEVNGLSLATLERVKKSDESEKSGAKQKNLGGLRELEGTWRVKSLETAGKRVPEEELKVMGWTFRGATLLLSGPGKKIKCAVKLDPSQNPKQIDITGLEGPLEGKTTRGIYKVEKGRLIVCIQEARIAGQDRPKEFATDATSGLDLATLERVNEAEEGPAADEPRGGNNIEAARRAPQKKSTDAEELRSLQGDWKVVALEAPNGETVPAEVLEKMRWVFKGAELRSTDTGGNPQVTCTIKTDPNNKPKQIDLAIIEGERKGETLQGIFKREGERLILCLRDDAKGRPKEFAAKKDGGQSLITLERVPNDKKQEDPGLKKLAGVWNVLSIEGSGSDTPEDVRKAMRWTFKGATLELSNWGEGSDTILPNKIEMNSSVVPKQIDITRLDERSDGKAVEGIYKVEKGRLYICIRDEKFAGQGRPTEFEGDEQKGLGLAILERVQGGEEKEAKSEERKNPLKED